MHRPLWPWYVGNSSDSSLNWLWLRSWSISSPFRCGYGHTNAGFSQVLPPTGCFSFHLICSINHLLPQIIISTGKSDWGKDIIDDKNSLAAAITDVISNPPPLLPTSPRPPSPVNGNVKDTRTPPKGLFLTSDSNRTSVLNGSHKTLCHEDDRETVLVFPDFKVVTEVRRSVEGAQELWNSAVDPSLGRSGAYLEKSVLKTWVLPYSCVILLCWSLPRSFLLKLTLRFFPSS